MAMVDPHQAALDLFRQWVIKALQSKIKGNPVAYWKLVDQMETIRGDVDKVRVFSLCVSSFDSIAHEALLTQLLGLSLWSCTPAVSEALLHFAINLACVRPSCLPLALDFLVRSFMPPSCGVPAFMGLTGFNASAASQQQQLALAIAASRNNKGMDLQQKHQVLARVEAALSQVLTLVPQAPSVLAPLITTRLPHRRLEKEFQCLYFEAMLRVAEIKRQQQHQEQQGALSDALLAIVVDHLIHIDVEIRWEDILEKQQLLASEEEEEEEGKGQEGGDKEGHGRKGARSVYCFHMDLDDTADEECVPAPHVQTSAAVGPGSEASALHGLVACRGQEGAVVDDMADKMDALMDLTLEHIERRASSGPEAAFQVYKALERSFDATILETHKSKFTQFLVFFVCSLPASPHEGLESSQHKTRTPAAASAFVAHLCSILRSTTHSPSARLSAAAYLASFIARASYVSEDTILNTISELITWCLEAEAHTTASSPSPFPVPPPLPKVTSLLVPKKSSKERRGRDENNSPKRMSTVLSSPVQSSRDASASDSLDPLQRTPSASAFHSKGTASLNTAPAKASATHGSASRVPHSCSSSMVSSNLHTHSNTETQTPRVVLKGACQAILYILCFRLKDLSSNSMQILRSLPLDALLLSPLQPLKTCLESITTEFMRQATSLHLFDTEIINAATQISRNGASPAPRMRLHFGADATQGLDSLEQHCLDSADETVERLDMFFPFDPYLLRTSLRFIRPIFNSWKQPLSNCDREVDESSEDDMLQEDRSTGEDEWSSEDEMGGREVAPQMSGVHGAEDLGWPAFGSNDAARTGLIAQKMFQGVEAIHSGLSPVQFSPSSYEADQMMLSCTPPSANLPPRLHSTILKRL